jgi:tetratricopeptide (TPR) repeat protein
MHIREILVSLHPAGKPARTDEEARKRAEEIAAKAKPGADFAALATAESDDPAGKKSGGSQPIMMLSGYPAEMQQAMANLKPGEVSQPVKTGAGYVIVKVDARTRDLPKDFEKNKPQLLASFVQRRQSQAWDAYQQKLRQSAKIDVTDPEMLAYRAIEQNKQKDALAQMQKAAAEAGRQRGLVGAIIYYNLAMMYAANNQWKEAADNFRNAADTVTQDQKQSLPDARAQALLGLAQADEKLGQKDEALNMYQEASNWADTPGVHSQLIGVYQRLGKADLAKKEQDWLVQYQQQQMEKQKAMLEQQKAAGAPQPAQAPAGQAPAPGKPAAQAPAPKPAAQAPAASKPAGPAPLKPAAPKPAGQTAPQPAKSGR